MKKVILNSSGKPYLDNGKPIMVDIPESSGGSSEPTTPTQDAPKSTLTIYYECTFVVWTGSSDEYSDGIHITEYSEGMTINTLPNSIVLLLGMNSDEPTCLYEIESEENNGLAYLFQYYNYDASEDTMYCHSIIAPDVNTEGEVD